MKLRLYNTLTKQKEDFQSVRPGHVKIYTCGVTVYDYCHIGHARGAVNFDVLRSVLEKVGYKVTFIRNYTDIDDKIIHRANERNISCQKLTQEMITYHDEDMNQLGIRKPDVAPKATEHIPEILAMIENLVSKKMAYEHNGDVFYRVRKFQSYGKLSGKNIDDLSCGIRVEVKEEKEDALDFVLWKAAKPGEPSWDSPWGKGRPGWHIECSAMSHRYLGVTLDIHAGGSDLIFPHHENEIAQSEGCHLQPFTRYWLHNGMVKMDGSKMSKSEGNFMTIRKLFEYCKPEVLRFFLLTTHYRSALNFSENSIRHNAEGLDRIYSALEKVESLVSSVPIQLKNTDPELQEYEQNFLNALCDDLNTPQAISILFELTKKLNISIDQPEIALPLYSKLLELGKILSILQQPAHTWFRKPRFCSFDQDISQKELSGEEIENLIQERQQARENKNWETADRIRDQLKENSIVLEDREKKTFWSRTS